MGLMVVMSLDRSDAVDEPFDFRAWSHKAADWATDYRESLDSRPVRPKAIPGAIAAQIADAAPEDGETMESIFADFERIIPDGMTHWQHPRFFAYFQSNAAPAAQLAEQLATAFASQCMLWQTSPAATELEIKMVDWLRQAVGLPDDFKGSFQDTASSATLCAVLTMRERALEFKGNQEGLFGKQPLRIYASERTHSSIDKALWVAGLGQDNLVKIPTGPAPLFAMQADALREAIARDPRRRVCTSRRGNLRWWHVNWCHRQCRRNLPNRRGGRSLYPPRCSLGRICNDLSRISAALERGTQGRFNCAQPPQMAWGADGMFTASGARSFQPGAYDGHSTGIS